jgi:tetratricopeptide (TPR) repeat protein
LIRITIYNQAVDLIQKEKIEKAKKKIEIAILINPGKAENYITLSAMYLRNENIQKAINNKIKELKEDNKNSKKINMDDF